MSSKIYKNSTIFGQTAFNIYEKISKGENVFNFTEIHLKSHSEQFVEFQKCNQPNNKRKRISNCKVELMIDSITYLIFKDASPSLPLNLRVNLMINSNLETVNIENILDVEINTLLEPLFNLRKCKNINEALMNWSLNKKFFNFQTYIDHRKIIYENYDENYDNNYFKNRMRWFLSLTNVQTFVPHKFLKKVRVILLKKENVLNDCLDVITNINKHFIKMVRLYHKQEQVVEITPYILNFPIEFYGQKDELYNDKKRKSLYLFKKNDDYLRLKSFAILFNLRWFFNTRYNSKKPLGFDGEYGQTINGYGQTFHKYDDVLLWLVTHPNTIEDVEFVILDPIPPNYIFI